MDWDSAATVACVALLLSALLNLLLRFPNMFVTGAAVPKTALMYSWVVATDAMTPMPVVAPPPDGHVSLLIVVLCLHVTVTLAAAVSVYWYTRVTAGVTRLKNKSARLKYGIPSCEWRKLDGGQRDLHYTRFLIDTGEDARLSLHLDPSKGTCRMTTLGQGRYVQCQLQHHSTAECDIRNVAGHLTTQEEEKDEEQVPPPTSQSPLPLAKCWKCRSTNVTTRISHTTANPNRPFDVCRNCNQFLGWVFNLLAEQNDVNSPPVTRSPFYNSLVAGPLAAENMLLTPSKLNNLRTALDVSE